MTFEKHHGNYMYEIESEAENMDTAFLNCGVNETVLMLPPKI